MGRRQAALALGFCAWGQRPCVLMKEKLNFVEFIGWIR